MKKKKKKTTGCGANIRVSGHMFLCSVLSRYKVLLIDVKDNEYEKRKEKKLWYKNWARTAGDGITDCRCIMCSTAIKVAQEGGKVVTMETSFV